MDYRAAYDIIAALLPELQYGVRNWPPYLDGPDYKAVKALAAAYELHEYLANKVAADDEEEIFGKMMQEVAAEEGRRLIQENERLKNDPDAAVPETLHKKRMEILGG